MKRRNFIKAISLAMASAPLAVEMASALTEAEPAIYFGFEGLLDINGLPFYQQEWIRLINESPNWRAYRYDSQIR